MGQMIVTTSWDDGHRLDLRLADLLRTLEIRGTFYIAPRNREFTSGNRLDPTDICALAKDFDIGSHTMTHPVLTRVGSSVASGEIGDSRKFLEDASGRVVDTFCYPRGRYSATHVKMVKAAGYRYARTVRPFAATLPRDPFQARTTLEAGRFARWRAPLDLSHASVLTGRSPLRLRSWEDLAVALFDKTYAQSGVFHLWGHSWVLDSRAEWIRLERVLAYIGRRQDVRYMTNSEVAGHVTTSFDEDR